MCLSALPPHLNTIEEIEANFPDDSQFGDGLWKRFKKWMKPRTVFGPRDVHWWHRWRELPITLFAVFGRGESRWEESNGLFAVRSVNDPIFFCDPHTVYLSRVQYWTDWHIQIQWPLFINVHVKINGQVWQAYFGCKRDADRVYWFPSWFIGKGWK